MRYFPSESVLILPEKHFVAKNTTPGIGNMLSSGRPCADLGIFPHNTPLVKTTTFEDGTEVKPWLPGPQV